MSAARSRPSRRIRPGRPGRVRGAPPGERFQETAMSAKATRTPSVQPPKLPTEIAQARRFGKTRSAQSTALLEDYVELIADLLAGTGEARPTDIARRLGVSHATAIKMISRLKREGVATARPYRGVFLTASGHAARGPRQRPPPPRGRRAAGAGSARRGRRGRRRRHRTPRLRCHAQGLRPFPARRETWRLTFIGARLLSAGSSD